MSLDHLVLLSAPNTLPSTISFLSPYFNILPGGTHKGGATANSLVPLPSGSYLELIHFLVPPEGTHHVWSKKLPGHIDWALLGEPTRAQRKRVEGVEREREGKEGEGWRYDAGVEGGRMREDGVQVDWVNTGPGPKQGRGGTPFFCGDRTPRELRVPALFAPHPSKALSISHLTLLTIAANYDSLKAYLEAPPSHHLPDFDHLPSHVAQRPTAGIPQAEIVLRLPESDEESAYLTSRGPHAFYELGFFTSRDGGKDDVVVEEGTGSRCVFKRV